MLEKLKSLFNKPAAQEVSAPDEKALSVAALLVEAARADETYLEAEKHLIDKSLAVFFDLTPDAATALRRHGEQAQSDAIDLHRFTKHAKKLNQEDKMRLMEALWTLVLVDGDRDSFEDAFIRRLCGLIYVEDQQSALARQQAQEKLNT